MEEWLIKQVAEHGGYGPVFFMMIFFIKKSTDSLKTLASSVDKLNTSVELLVTNDAVTRSKVETIEEDVKRLKDTVYK